MLQPILSYLTQKLSLYFPTAEIIPLASLVAGESEERPVTFPAQYCQNGEFNPIDFDFHSGVLYFRLNGDMRERTLSEDESPDFDIYKERTYSLRLVVCVPKDIYKTDDAFIEQKIAENITKAISLRNPKNLLDTLNGIISIQSEITGRQTEPQSVWNEEYNGVDYSMPFNRVFLALNIDITVEASLECFNYWGCHDEPLEPVIPERQCPECPPTELKLKYADNSLWKAITHDTIIADNIIYEADGTTEHERLRPEQPFTLPACPEPDPCEDATVHNTDNSYSVSVASGADLEIADINIANTDNSYTNTYQAKKDYIIPNTPLKDSAGGALGSYPSVFPITAPDAALQDSAGNPVTAVKSGGLFTLADAVAKNSAGTTVDTKPYGQLLSIGDSKIFKADNTTPLISLAAETNTNTAAVIALMSAAEIHADLTTAGKIAALLALYTNSNLSTLSSAQRDYVVTILTNTNLANLSTEQKNYIVTILGSVQVQLLSNPQLLMMSTAQVAYVVSQAAPTTYNFPVYRASTTSYANGDAAWVQANYFNSLPIGITPRLTDFYNLRTFPNIYGNFKRFTGITGGYQHDDGSATYYDASGAVTTEALAFPSNYVIDHFTGLGWERQTTTSYTWANAVAQYATRTLVVNGVTYSDWFLMDRPKLESIMYANTSGTFSPNVIYNGNVATWTSNTGTTTTDGFRIGHTGPGSGQLTIETKTTSRRGQFCRKHF